MRGGCERARIHCTCMRRGFEVRTCTCSEDVMYMYSVRSEDVR